MSLKIVERAGTYYVRGTVLGVRVKKSTGLPARREYRKLAEQKRQEEEKRIIESKVSPHNRTWLAASEAYQNRSEGVGPADLKTIKRADKHFGKADIAELDVDSFVKKFHARHGNETIRRSLTTIRAVLNHAVANGYDGKITKFKLPEPGEGRVRWITRAQRDKFLAAMRELSPHVYPLAIFLLYTGCRLTQALRLQWKDVDLSEQTAVVKTRKGARGRERTVSLTLHPVVVEVLKGLLAAKDRPPKPGAYVFLSSRGQPWSIGEDWTASASIGKHWKAAAKQAGITDFRIHDARHTFASLLRQEGVDLPTIGDLLGHASLVSTRRYGHLGTTATRKIVEKL